MDMIEDDRVPTVGREVKLVHFWMTLAASAAVAASTVFGMVWAIGQPAMASFVDTRFRVQLNDPATAALITKTVKDQITDMKLATTTETNDLRNQIGDMKSAIAGLRTDLTTNNTALASNTATVAALKDSVNQNFSVLIREIQMRNGTRTLP